MKGNREVGKFLWRIVQVGIILLTLLGCIKAIFISLDIDESYAVAQSYRLACGDRLFVDMWESHQLSAFLGAIFIKPYVMLFHTTDYLVIYLRIVGLLIHIGMGVWLYRRLQLEFDRNASFLILFLHLNFLPKWVQQPEFELMHYWFLVAIFLLLYDYFRQEKGSWWRPALAGLCLVGSMMSYPTMILLYPIYLLGLCVLEQQKHDAKGRELLRSGLWFTVGAGVSGVLFLAYLFSYQTMEEFQKNLSYIFLDESHTQYTTAEKWGMYAGQAGDIALSYLIYVIIAVAIIAVFVLMTRLILRKNFAGKNIDFVVLGVLILAAFAVQINQLWGCLFLDENQFYLQTRYLAMILPGLYLAVRYHKKYSVFLYLCLLPGLVALPAVLAVTNMNVNVSSAKVFLGVLGSMLILFAHMQEKAEQIHVAEKVERVLVYSLVLGLLAGFFVCRLILIRVSGCLPVTVKAPLEQMQEGPEKGVYVLQTQAQIWNENYRVIQEVVEEDDRMLYVGAEHLIYPAAGCMVASPSTQGTTIFNEMFLYYYEEHPERLPNVIVIDKTFGTNPVYSLFSDTELILDWIERNYGDASVEETQYLKILYLED